MRIPETNYYEYTVGPILLSVEILGSHLSFGFCLGLEKGDRHIGFRFGPVEVLIEPASNY